MLVIALLAARLLGPCDTPDAEPLRTVCPYLAALQDLDHDAMAARWAPAVVSVDARGESRAVDVRAARDMRAFEREMRTRWLYTVDSVRADSVFVTMREANDFYDLLGVGTRTQSEVYIVSAGRISEMRTSAVTHPGGDFRPAYQGFRRWLVDTARVRDPDLVEDGGLRFTGRSAKRMRPWLERWRRTRGS
jgi:limonene-1,2-epoxide hydrolase